MSLPQYDRQQSSCSASRSWARPGLGGRRWFAGCVCGGAAVSGRLAHLLERPAALVVTNDRDRTVLMAAAALSAIFTSRHGGDYRSSFAGAGDGMRTLTVRRIGIPTSIRRS